MHPGPMNRGVEIDSLIADGAQSLIREQVEMGVAVRMAVLAAVAVGAIRGTSAFRSSSTGSTGITRMHTTSAISAGTSPGSAR